MSSASSNFREQLKEKGYKLTTQRQAVVDVIEKNEGKHLSCEEIHQLVKKSHPEIGLATVYRTMMLLDRLELVYKQDLDDGLSRYELNTRKKDHKHHHLICTACGEILEVEDDLLESLEEEILKKNRFIVKDHRVKFYGLCEKCWTRI